MFKSSRLLLLSFLLLSQSWNALAKEPDWSLYNTLLKQYVIEGNKKGIASSLIDYQSLVNDQRFNKVVHSIESFNPKQLANIKERLSFYINAYNILAIKMVVDNYPIESIKDAGSFFKPVWHHVAGSINGKDITLDDLEHNILRKIGEARVHFAIVCASLSCPDIRDEAYTATKLDQQLDSQVKHFLNNRQKGLQIKDKDIKASKIFRWFEEDFKSYGGVLHFIDRYHPLPKHATFKGHLSYDWSLNQAEQPSQAQKKP